MLVWVFGFVFWFEIFLLAMKERSKIADE